MKSNLSKYFNDDKIIPKNFKLPYKFDNNELSMNLTKKWLDEIKNDNDFELLRRMVI